MTEYICTNCNRKLYPTDKVCDYCGSPVIFESEEYSREIEFDTRFKKRRKWYLAIYTLILVSSVAVYLRVTVFKNDAYKNTDIEESDVVENSEGNGIAVEKETAINLNDIGELELAIGDSFIYDEVKYEIMSFAEFDNINGEVVDPGDGYKWYELLIKVTNNSKEEKYIDINGTYWADGNVNSTFPSIKYKSEDTINIDGEQILGIRVCKSDISKIGEYIWPLDESANDIKIKLY